VEIYRLSRLGYALSHSTRNPNTPEWAVIHYLAKMHSASKEKLFAEVPGASSTTLRQLRAKRIVIEETGVAV
jgi:hypothetical protein